MSLFASRRENVSYDLTLDGAFYRLVFSTVAYPSGEAAVFRFGLANADRSDAIYWEADPFTPDETIKCARRGSLSAAYLSQVIGVLRDRADFPHALLVHAGIEKPAPRPAPRYAQAELAL